MNKKPLILLGISLLTIGCNKPVAVPETLDPAIVESAWGVEAAKDCYDQLSTVIPYVYSENFEYEMDVDGYGDPIINFYLFYETDEDAVRAWENFANICTNAGYETEMKTLSYFDYEQYVVYQYDCVFADIVIGEHHGVEIQGVVSTYKEKPCLGLFCFTYLYIDKDTYPELAITRLLGEEDGANLWYFPKFELEDYFEYSFAYSLVVYSDEEDAPTYPALEIVVDGVPYTIEEEILYSAFSLGDVYKLDTMDDDYFEEFAIEDMEDYYYEDEYYFMVYLWYGPRRVMIFYDVVNYSQLIIDIYVYPEEM